MMNGVKMRLTAVDVNNGRVLLTQSGTMSEQAFKRTVMDTFPHLNPDDVAFVSDAKKKPDARGYSGKSVVWQGSFCFHPDSKVLTTDGVKKIKDVAVGDMVFTHLGRPRKVLRTHARKWDGDMVVVKNALDREEMILTPCHSVLGVKGTPCVLRASQTCKPTCQVQHAKKKYMTSTGEHECLSCVRRPYQGYSLQEIKAGELATRDFLYLPKLGGHSKQEVNACDYMTEWNKWSNDGEWMWPSQQHNATNDMTVARSIGIDENTLWRAKGTSKHVSDERRLMVRTAIEEAAKRPPQFDPTSKVNRIPTKYRLDYDFGRFLGLYVAEGSGGNVIAFAFHEDEIEFHEFVANFIRSRLHLASGRDDDKSKKSTCIMANSVILGKLLPEWCGHDSHSKKIPDFVFSTDDETITGFINGLWDGDGNKKARPKDNTIKYSTVSASLAYGLRLLLSRFDVTAAVSTEYRKERKTNSTTWKATKVYVVRISGQQLYENEWLKKFKYNTRPHAPKHARSRQYYATDEGAFLQVTSVSRRPYNGTVHDLEVEDDHTYTVNGKAVHNSDLGGYANLNREIVLRLAQHGYSVKINMLRTAPQVDQMTMNLLKALESTTIADEKNCPLVVGFTPMPVQRSGRRVIFYTMMESQGLHKEFVARCNSCASEVWVPCRFYEKVFRDAGVCKPISVIPLGTNQHLYTPDAREPEGILYEEFPSGKTVDKPVGFRFMSLFGWSYRKGPDILCKAFLSAFDAGDDACLVIYSRYMGSSAGTQKDHVRREIMKYIEGCGKQYPPRIYWCGDEIPIPDLPGCYAASDCFVFCSRGEGFALPVVEAGACGIPVVSAMNTGMTEYLDDECAYLVRPEGIAPANDELTWISEFYRDQKFAVMGDKSVGEFARLMREVRDDPAEAARRAERFRKKVIERYTWDKCAAEVASRLSSG
jgi:glycosyltransferase involved in cell wall biosynthesis